jgi:biopolymer transport protein ExbD
MERLRNPSGDDAYPADDDPEIDIIPLVDVMLLLLTFFIFVTLAMVMQEGVGVSLASAESSKSVKKKEPLVISIRQSGQFFLNKDEISVESLRDRLRKRAESSSKQPVFLNADKSAEHQYVIKALDMVRTSGIENVTFTVKPQE